MAKEDLIAHLIKVSYEEVGKRGFVFSQTAEIELIDLVTSGVDTMIRTNRTDSDNIALAERNIRKFCNELCDKAEGKGRIVESREFSTAHWTICPLWPFC